MPEGSAEISEEIKNLESPASLESQMVTGGMIKANPDYNPQLWSSKRYVVDFEGTKKLLQDYQNTEEHPTILFGEGQIKAEGEKSFRRVVKALVDHGDIPAALALQIGRVMRPSDILTHNESFARFLYMDNDFPGSAEGRAHLEIGTEYANGWAFKDMKDATAETGLSLTDEQIFRLVLRNAISHEYGHAIERVILLLKGQGATEKEQLTLKNIIEQSVYDSIAPRPELQQLLEEQPKEGWAVNRGRTSSERIAVGYETLGIRYALEEMGLDNKTVEDSLNNLGQRDRDRLDRNTRLIQQLSAGGLTIQDLADAKIDIYANLSDRGEKHLSKSLTFGLDARSLGYSYPLTRDELQKFVAQWTSQTITSPDRKAVSQTASSAPGSDI